MRAKIKLIADGRKIFVNEKEITPGVSQKIWNHSPDGFSWGYSGSGPAQAALAIMLEIQGNPNFPVHYQEFKEHILTKKSMDADHEFVVEFQENTTGKGERGWIEVEEDEEPVEDDALGECYNCGRTQHERLMVTTDNHLYCVPCSTIQ